MGIAPYMTPYIDGTPLQNFKRGQTSEYGATPGNISVYDAAFSPGLVNIIASPYY